MIQFREYQKQIISKAVNILKQSKFVYLSMEVRTGKTLTALGSLDLMSVNRVLFITKKKAIGSIVKDYESLSPGYKLEVINYESLHKVQVKGWDAVVCDEAHSMGAFPRPSKRAKQVKTLLIANNPYVILLSGTPTPESFSQMYHQVYGIETNPFSSFKTFYKFAKEHVNTVQRKINGFMVNDYSNAKQSVLHQMQPYMISYTQREAGFETSITENVLTIEAPEIIYKLCNKLKKDLVIEGQEHVILADTSVKLMQKLHQMYSGTVKFEDGKSMVLDTFKAEYIKNYFKDKKIAIFYKFKEEYNALKEVYGSNICNTLEEFCNTEKNIALQIVSGREGISLKEADALVYYNIDFSATSYWQSRDRMTTKKRLNNNVYWVFTSNGIEPDIYKAVTKKKDYTLKHFKKDLLSV
jgi:tRNA A37 threonylcarbamoyladenosine biosynthesis protein TsaE